MIGDFWHVARTELRTLLTAPSCIRLLLFNLAAIAGVVVLAWPATDPAARIAMPDTFRWLADAEIVFLSYAAIALRARVLGPSDGLRLDEWVAGAGISVTAALAGRSVAILALCGISVILILPLLALAALITPLSYAGLGLLALIVGAFLMGFASLGEALSLLGRPRWARALGAAAAFCAFVLAGAIAAPSPMWISRVTPLYYADQLTTLAVSVATDPPVTTRLPGADGAIADAPSLATPFGFALAALLYTGALARRKYRVAAEEEHDA